MAGPVAFSERAAAATAARSFTASMIERLGPRLTGGVSCLAAADGLAEAARPHADAVYSADFPVRPMAFLGFIRMMLVLYLAALAALPFLPWAAFDLLLLGAVILVGQFFLYKEMIDPLFRKRTGRNVWAVLEPSGPAARQLIVSGHHDSARIFRFYTDRPELYGRRLYGGMGAYAVFTLAAMVLAFIGPGRPVLLAASVLFALAFLFLATPLWTFASREGTPGAGDNLAASAAALEILKAFRAERDSGGGLSSTRLVFASFDAEEAGLRGARAWAAHQGPALTALPTWNYNMDCLYDARNVRFLTSDINGSVGLCGKTAAACAELVRERGLPAAAEPIAFLTGGTDAAELAKAGVKATTLIGMSWSNQDRAASYHTPADTIDAVGEGILELAIGVGIGFARKLDSGGMD